MDKFFSSLVVDVIVLKNFNKLICLENRKYKNIKFDCVFNIFFILIFKEY